VRRSGHSWAHPLLILFAARSESGTTRIGITVGRQVGGAVVRNRVRRRISESVRKRHEGLPVGWDLVFVARAASAEAGYWELAAAVEALLVRAGLLASAA
jgi:ribonuclease P protein component